MLNKNSSSFIIFISGITIVVACLGAYFFTLKYISSKNENFSVSPISNTLNQNREGDGSENLPVSIENKPKQQLLFAHAQYGFNPADTNELVTNSPHVFLARVIARKENHVVKNNFFLPLFEVRLISDVKDVVSPSIELIQADIEYRDGLTYVMSGDIAWPRDIREEDILLDIGAIYLFVAYDPKIENRYGIGMAPFDRVLISSDPNISFEAAVDLAKQNSRVQEIIEAVSKEGTLDQAWR